MVERVAILGDYIVKSSAIVRRFGGFSSSFPRSFLSYFLLLFCYYSCVYFLFLFRPCCSHALGILCGIQPRAWDLRSLLFILDGLLYFEAKSPNRCYQSPYQSPSIITQINSTFDVNEGDCISAIVNHCFETFRICLHISLF